MNTARPSAPPVHRDDLGFFHPRDEPEISLLIHHAREHGLCVRVRGAGHSIPAAIHADTRFEGLTTGAVELLLDQVTHTRFDDARSRVSVGAGCRLGSDPTGRWPGGPGLCEQLAARGWALPNLGGITHQTVAGFFTTGSAGGSVQHGLSGCVVGLRLVDGLGRVHELTRESANERLDAVAVSMGLCGVITELTLACEPAYDVMGDEVVFDDAMPGFDPFSDGEDGFEALLRKEPYARLLWWPQPGVNRFQLWRARRMTSADAVGTRDASGQLIPVPYQPIEPIAGSIETAQQLAAKALGVLGGWRQGVGEALGAGVVESLDWLGAQRLESAVLRAFTPLGPPKPFRDSWHRALPMDNAVADEVLPTSFTELWLPLAKAGEVMRRLRKLYAEVPGAAGNFATELYAGAPSSFWMAPGQPGASVRINPFWYDRNPGEPRATLFAHLFETFKDLGFRLHWGKALPLDAQGSSAALAKQYPRWHDFLAVRRELDPSGVFLTKYWRAHLGLTEDAPVEAHRVPLRRDNFLPAHEPLRFTFEPAQEALFEQGSHHFLVEATVPAPAHRVSASFADIAQTFRWMPGFQGVRFLTRATRGHGSICDELFWFMNIRIRVLREVAGREWVAVVEGCTLPLATKMIERVTFEELTPGQTRVRWHTAFDVPRVLAPFFPMVGPLFKALFHQGLQNFARLDWSAPNQSAQ